MASATASQIFDDNSIGISKQEIQAAIAKAVELRALHASLMQTNSPATFRLPTCASPSLPRPSSQFSAQDYPIFTPSYEEDPAPGYKSFRFDNGSMSDIWDGYGVLRRYGDEDDSMDGKSELSSCRKGSTLPPLPPSMLNREFLKCAAQEDNKSITSSCTNHIATLQNSPSAEILKSSRRTTSIDLKSVTTCNQCKPATISCETEISNNKLGTRLYTAPQSDSHSSVQSHSKNKGPLLSRLFPRLRKKNKNEASPNQIESEDGSQILKEYVGIMSIESLKKELIEAKANRDAALMEASEMKFSLGELKDKLEHLETHCEELKKGLKQAIQGKDSQVLERLGDIPKIGKSVDEKNGRGMPLSHEEMVEGFLQIVAEARLSVKQFCKTLVSQIEDTDSNLMEKLNVLLQPYRLNINSKHLKVVLYHLEGLINQSLYQDFESSNFQKNGSPKFLDPQQEREAQFSSFVSLRNLSWNEVLRKGTKYYSDEFSKFCDQKMSCIIATLNWTRPWPEQLLQAFFVAAKCIWLLHLLAFSFNPALGILRVEEKRSYDPHYMEDIFLDRQRSQTPNGVKIMVMPGFYVHDKVLKCRVLCRYKSVA
ncbi:Irk-interacting protein [Thalictrum thalictroides]|uniref:Irk-interacting protein n=1 Tax=Thalictrum thalictroides TaxID=46969 RepID=A0A7J6VRR2_THATH|nr:Irk-interacting protein [Thalictrum thalictroides]